MVYAELNYTVPPLPTVPYLRSNTCTNCTLHTVQYRYGTLPSHLSIPSRFIHWYTNKTKFVSMGILWRVYLYVDFFLLKRTYSSLWLSPLLKKRFQIWINNDSRFIGKSENNIPGWGFHKEAPRKLRTKRRTWRGGEEGTLRISIILTCVKCTLIRITYAQKIKCGTGARPKNQTGVKQKTDLRTTIRMACFLTRCLTGSSTVLPTSTVGSETSRLISKMTSCFTGIRAGAVILSFCHDGSWTWPENRVGIKKPTQKNPPNKTQKKTT